MKRFSACAAAGAVIFAAGCASGPKRAAVEPPQEMFWGNLESLCGRAFEGRVIEDSTANPEFMGQRLVMHVRMCENERILVPFMVGDDRSRTWVFSRSADGLRLQHDHRHEDGTEDEVTMYGGDTRTPGLSRVQRFHADARTAELIPAAATNVWTVELVPGKTFTYSLEREGTDRKFKAEFDLSREVPPPPAPWGWGW